MIQKEGLFCVCICREDGESKKKRKIKEQEQERGKRDLTSALLEMGFLWMGELGEG